MRLRVTSGDRRLLVLAGIILAAMLGVALFIASGTGDRGEVTTSYSSSSAGTRALYLTLASTGYRVERWEDPPAALRDPASTTLILAEPIETPSTDDLNAITAFMEAGGRIIATGPASAWFVSRSAHRRLPSGRTWRTVQAIAPTPATLAAPEITMAERAAWNESGWLVVPLYGERDEPSVVDVAVGLGGVTWLEAATPLTNAGISASGNLEFVLASLGAPGARQILFDEYFHGQRRTLVAAMWHSPTKWVALQIALVGAIVLLTFSRRSGPIIPPAVESRLSPLEFVRTLGSLYERAGASSVVVDAADRRARSWIARRFGISARASAGEIAAAVARRTGRDTAALEQTLRACEGTAPAHPLDEKRALAVAQTLADELRSLRGSSRTTEDL
jgi:hypothetical protein